MWNTRDANMPQVKWGTESGVYSRTKNVRLCDVWAQSGFMRGGGGGGGGGEVGEITVRRFIELQRGPSYILTDHG